MCRNGHRRIFSGPRRGRPAMRMTLPALAVAWLACACPRDAPPAPAAPPTDATPGPRGTTPAPRRVDKSTIKDGQYEERSADDKVLVRAWVKNGEFHGEFTRWDEQGRVLDQGSYVNGKREGRWTVTDPVQKVAGKGDYQQDQRHGEWTFWSRELGTLEATYEHGVEMGRWVRSHPNHHRAEMGQMLAGKRTGFWQSWAPDGTQLTSEGAYWNGQKAGFWRTWSPDGAPLPDELYEEGVLVTPSPEPASPPPVALEVFWVGKRGAAESAGLKRGDVINAVDDVPFSDGEAFAFLVQESVADKRLRVTRGEEALQLDVKAQAGALVPALGVAMWESCLPRSVARPPSWDDALSASAADAAADPAAISPVRDAGMGVKGLVGAQDASAPVPDNKARRPATLPPEDAHVAAGCLSYAVQRQLRARAGELASCFDTLTDPQLQASTIIPVRLGVTATGEMAMASVERTGPLGAEWSACVASALAAGRDAVPHTPDRVDVRIVFVPAPTAPLRAALPDDIERLDDAIENPGKAAMLPELLLARARVGRGCDPIGKGEAGNACEYGGEGFKEMAERFPEHWLSPDAHLEYFASRTSQRCEMWTCEDVAARLVEVFRNVATTRVAALAAGQANIMLGGPPLERITGLSDVPDLANAVKNANVPKLEKELVAYHAATDALPRYARAKALEGVAVAWLRFGERDRASRVLRGIIRTAPGYPHLARVRKVLALFPARSMRMLPAQPMHFTTVLLRWDAPPVSVETISVRRDEREIAVVPGSARHFLDRGLGAAEEHSYSLHARSGEETVSSNVVTAITPDRTLIGRVGLFSREDNAFYVIGQTLTGRVGRGAPDILRASDDGTAVERFMAPRIVGVRDLGWGFPADRYLGGTWLVDWHHQAILKFAPGAEPSDPELSHEGICVSVDVATSRYRVGDAPCLWDVRTEHVWRPDNSDSRNRYFLNAAGTEIWYGEHGGIISPVSGAPDWAQTIHLQGAAYNTALAVDVDRHTAWYLRLLRAGGMELVKVRLKGGKLVWRATLEELVHKGSCSAVMATNPATGDLWMLLTSGPEDQRPALVKLSESGTVLLNLVP
ncbi:MAG: PDZ domain-containing protein [Myxococcota bacterium]